MWNPILIHLETVLVSVQDSCTVYAKCTASSEIILDAPDGTPRRHGSCESCSDLFGDSVSVGARLVHERLKWMLVSFRLEIVLILMQDRCTI
jgi:hypothetical protein